MYDRAYDAAHAAGIAVHYAGNLVSRVLRDRRQLQPQALGPRPTYHFTHLRIASAIHPRDLGLVGYLGANALGDVLRVAAKYLPLLTEGTRVEVVATGERVRVEQHLLDPAGAGSRQVAGLGASSLSGPVLTEGSVRLARRLAGGDPLLPGRAQPRSAAVRLDRGC